MQHSKKIQDLFKKIDIFGVRVDVRINEKKIHKTYSGAVLTLVLSIIMVI